MAEKKQTLTLPIIVTRSLVVFPETQQIIEAGREISKGAVVAAKSFCDSLIYVSAQKDPSVDNPNAEDIYETGCLCKIISVVDKTSHLRVRVTVLDRVKLTNIIYEPEYGSLTASGEICPRRDIEPAENDAIHKALEKAINDNINTLSNAPKTVFNNIMKADNPYTVCYSLASVVEGSTALKQEVINADDIKDIFKNVLILLNSEKQKRQIEQEISDTVRESAEKNQREYFLREKLKAIRHELGDDTSGANDPDSILEKLEQNPYPENIKAKVKAEVKKFQMMPQGSLEAALIQNYLDVLLSIPWWQKTEDNDSLENVEKILDEDHYGLENPKKRIIEYLAVKKLTGNLKSPILCFYGPPGTGKTSLGKSIARALGRKFFKASLGGISDEAEIRGHRRTYVGSLPGRLIQGMRKAGVTNPVFLLDEVDKLASSYKGDPASALLEVLDPEQNTAFNDNYVEEPYDLSDVLFICTANYLENIPGPLRDRLELIPLSSYTELEKVQIAKNHLVKKQIELNGLKPDEVSFDDDAIKLIIRSYTAESGVRDLERKIASCLRKVAVAIVKDPSIKRIDINEEKVKEYLGVALYENSKKEVEPQVGVVTGLAYTEFGGDILPIEVNNFKGKGNLVLTGKLGDVMKESAAIALDYVKSNAEHFHIDPNIFENNDIHIHVPEGAVPKDGPSAGVAMTTAIISCLSHVPVNPDVAMTGEVTLRGNALPIGGLREKSLAALRSGIKTIIVPNGNKKDVDELPKEVKESLNIVYMKTVDDAIKVALVQND